MSEAATALFSQINEKLSKEFKKEKKLEKEKKGKEPFGLEVAIPLSTDCFTPTLHPHSAI